MAVALCGLSLFGAPAAQAAVLFDVGPGGPELASSTAVADTAAQASADLQAATVTDRHLPGWVQSVVSDASLYSSDTGNMSARVPRYAFMRVLNGGTSRLQVQLFDQNGNPAQQGWVDPSQVLPSASGTGWLVASQPTVLFGSADPGASSIRDLDPFTPLSQISTTVQQGRVEVWVYRSDFGDTTARGWVDVTATGPALPPQMRVTSPISASASLPGSSSRGNAQQQQVAFVQAAGQAARVAKAQTGVPASVTVAQAILESSWGQSELATAANNYFGVKAIGSIGDDGVIWMPTSEYDDSGQLYQTLSAFRAYKSLTDSTADHDWLLETSPRYAPAMRMANDPREFAELIAEEGYSTDPDYASKLVALMDSYNLYQFDS